MSKKINTTRYQFTHGRRPHGEGCWAFLFQVGSALESSCEFAPGNRLYSSAKVWAQARARELSRENGGVEVQIQVAT